MRFPQNPAAVKRPPPWVSPVYHALLHFLIPCIFRNHQPLGMIFKRWDSYTGVIFQIAKIESSHFLFLLTWRWFSSCLNGLCNSAKVEVHICNFFFLHFKRKWKLYAWRYLSFGAINSWSKIIWFKYPMTEDCLMEYYLH